MILDTSARDADLISKVSDTIFGITITMANDSIFGLGLHAARNGGMLQIKFDYKGTVATFWRTENPRLGGYLMFSGRCRAITHEGWEWIDD